MKRTIMIALALFLVLPVLVDDLEDEVRFDTGEKLAE